jgi:hypothetical protein
MTELEILEEIIKHKGCSQLTCANCFYSSTNQILCSLFKRLNEDEVINISSLENIYILAKARLKEIKLEKIDND